MSFYPSRIQEHYDAPRNTGDLLDADAIGEEGSLVCGAIVRLSLKIDATAQTITEAKFKTLGCGYLIACASALTETIRDLPISRAAVLNTEAITDWFGEWPPARAHCARLCRDALHAALADYHNARLEEWTGDEALICTCFGISEHSIENVIRTRELLTIEQVTKACNAGGGCRSCHPLIEDILDDFWRTQRSPGIS
jgi:NifU-like protein